MPPGLKLALDFGPLVVFFLGYRFGGLILPNAGLMVATGGLIAATLFSLAAEYWLERKLAVMPLITASVVTVFGGLSLYLQNDLFIKMKPTILNTLFALILLAGNFYGKPMLKYLLGTAVNMDDEGWKKLSGRWGLYFLFLAGLNESVWRNFSTDFWVDFKVFGMFSLSFLFTLSQIPLMKRHMIHEPETAPQPRDFSDS